DFGRLLYILTTTGALMPAAKSFRPAPLAKAGAPGVVPRQHVNLKSNAIRLQKSVESGVGAALASPVSGNVVQITASDALAIQESLAGDLTPPILAGKLQSVM